MGAVGIDFGAYLMMGDVLNADQGLLAQVLPIIERAALEMLRPEDEGGREED